MRSTFQLSFLRSTRVAALAILGALSVPPYVEAQQQLSPVQIDSRRAARQNEIADTLESRALALYGTPSKFFEAARLHRRAGVLRGEDPRSVQSFRSAAWMYSAAGDNSLARQMMETAAVRASGVGDIEKAAHSYIDAATLALESGDTDKVRTLLGKMRAVAGSPLLPADRRSQILARIAESTGLAKVEATH